MSIHHKLKAASFIAPKSNFTLIDPFFADCNIFYHYPSAYSTRKFHNVHGVQQCFGPKNILVVVAVMPLLFFFSNENYLFMYKVFLPSYLKDILSLQWFYRLFLDLSFIHDLRRLLVICKKYTSTYGQHSNYANVVVAIITRSSRRKKRGRCIKLHVEEVEGVQLPLWEETES